MKSVVLLPRDAQALQGSPQNPAGCHQPARKVSASRFWMSTRRTGAHSQQSTRRPGFRGSPPARHGNACRDGRGHGACPARLDGHSVKPRPAGGGAMPRSWTCGRTISTEGASDASRSPRHGSWLPRTKTSFLEDLKKRSRRGRGCRYGHTDGDVVDLHVRVPRIGEKIKDRASWVLTEPPSLRRRAKGATCGQPGSRLNGGRGRRAALGLSGRASGRISLDEGPSRAQRLGFLLVEWRQPIRLDGLRGAATGLGQRWRYPERRLLSSCPAPQVVATGNPRRIAEGERLPHGGLRRTSCSLNAAKRSMM